MAARVPSPSSPAAWKPAGESACQGRSRHLLVLTSRQAAVPQDLLLANRRPRTVWISTVLRARSLSGLLCPSLDRATGTTVARSSWPACGPVRSARVRLRPTRWPEPLGVWPSGRCRCDGAEVDDVWCLGEDRGEPPSGSLSAKEWGRRAAEPVAGCSAPSIRRASRSWRPTCGPE